VIVTGRGPHENVITPPAATAATTACEVQLAGVPSPTTWSGWAVLTGRPADGTNVRPAGLPAGGSRAGGGDELGLGAGERDIPARSTAELAAPAMAAPAPGDAVLAGGAPPQAASVTLDANATTSAVTPPLSRTRPHARSLSAIWVAGPRIAAAAAGENP
jgi:hypothetical protein